MVILLPVIGIVTFGLQLVADRYSYLSCLGWSVLGGATVLYLWQSWLGAVAPRSDTKSSGAGGPWVSSFDLETNRSVA